MRSFLITLCVLGAVTLANATSYLITLPQKLAYSCFIAHVRVTKVTPPGSPSDPTSPVLIHASVIELFKGPEQKEIVFSSHSYAHLESKALPGLVGKEFLVFLHDPDENGKLWLFEGPRGMRPIQDQYTEWRFDAAEKVVTDTYPYEQYLGILRRWKSYAEEEKKEPDQSSQPTRSARG
jgi:hypothetical protein